MKNNNKLLHYLLPVYIMSSIIQTIKHTKGYLIIARERVFEKGEIT